MNSNTDINFSVFNSLLILITWRTVLEKLIALQLVAKLPTFYSMTVFTSACTFYTYSTAHPPGTVQFCFDTVQDKYSQMPETDCILHITQFYSVLHACGCKKPDN